MSFNVDKIVLFYFLQFKIFHLEINKIYKAIDSLIETATDASENFLVRQKTPKDFECEIKRIHFALIKLKTQERHLHRNLHINRPKKKNPQIMSCQCAYTSETDT